MPTEWLANGECSGPDIPAARAFYLLTNSVIAVEECVTPGALCDGRFALPLRGLRKSGIGFARVNAHSKKDEAVEKR
jgi:hypothetical protein